MTTEPGVIPVGCEPPPMRDDQDRRRHQANTEAKGKSAGRRAGDRFAVLNGFVDFSLARLTRNEIAVWLILYRDTKDGTARTSQVDLGRRAGVSDRTVRNVLAKLKAKGLLRVSHQGGFRRGVSVYRVRPYPPNDSGKNCFRL